jgi:hypothetical protein
MRKLNKGHTIHVGYITNNITINSSQEIYEMINRNELKINEDNKLLLLFQYLKYYARKYYTKHYYEIELDIFKGKPTKETIRDKLKYNVFGYKLDDPVKNKLLEGTNYTTKEKAPLTTEILALLKMLFAYPLDDLIKLVFNTNTTQKEILSQIETQTVTETQVQSQISKYAPGDLYIYFRRLIIRYNPFVSSLRYFINNLIYQKLELGNNLLLFSYNLVKNIADIDSAIIVRLANNVFMLEHASLLNHYVYITPVYALDGTFINNFIFKDTNNIDFNKIFNYKLTTNDGRQFNLGYIIFGIDEEITPMINHHIEPNIMNDLDDLVHISNINIFRINDPSIIDIIKRNGKINLQHRLLLPNISLIKQVAVYLEDYYKFASRDSKITDNNPNKPRQINEKTTKFIYDLIFSIYDMNEVDYYTLIY